MAVGHDVKLLITQENRIDVVASRVIKRQTIPPQVTYADFFQCVWLFKIKDIDGIAACIRAYDLSVRRAKDLVRLG